MVQHYEELDAAELERLPPSLFQKIQVQLNLHVLRLLRNQ